MTFYEKAEQESITWSNNIRNDPFYTMPRSPAGVGGRFYSTDSQTLSYDPYSLKEEASTDPNEDKLYRKLAQLNAQLNSSSAKKERSKAKNPVTPLQKSAVPDDVDAVERFDERMEKEAPGKDPEMEQLNSMMEKILDIQHPERIREKLKTDATQHPERAFAIRSEGPQTGISLLSAADSLQGPSIGFYNTADGKNNSEENAVKAVVHQKQALVTGAVIKLRILDYLYLNGNRIQKGSFVFGTTVLNGERMQIEVASVRFNHSIFPVKLEAYDLDGLPGLYVPGAMIRDVAKQEGTNSLEMLQLTSIDPSLRGRAATTGINAATSLLSKKKGQVKVWVKGGYKVLLKNKNETP